MNNNNKGEIMNKLTKVGLSALAGSLAVVSANASEYSVTGDTQVVFSSAEGNEAGAVGSNGKGYGVDTDIYFTASGEQITVLLFLYSLLWTWSKLTLQHLVD